MRLILSAKISRQCWIVIIIAVVVALSGWLGITPKAALPARNGIVLPADAQASCSVSPSTFAGWFDSGKVSLNGADRPAGSDSFPDGPNCDFYQWSWQMFLWLTSPTPISRGGGGRHVFHSGVFFNVSALDSSGHRHFIPIDQTPLQQPEEGHPFIDVNMEQGQPQGGEVLMTRTGSLVYYSTMVNNVFTYFLTGTSNGNLQSTHFPINQRELDPVIAFGRLHGAGFPDSNAFAILVKTSWVEATSLPDPDNYILMKGTIPTYRIVDSANWVRNGQKTVTLAMVGMHVVGSTAGRPGHPEMIWATFEHAGNTPNAAYDYVDSNHILVTVPQNTTGNWLFCDDGAAGSFNEPHMTFLIDKIEAARGFTISPSNTLRMKPWGSASDNAASGFPFVNNTEVIAINNSIHGLLASGDVRSHYILIGATWTKDGRPPMGPFSPTGENELGENELGTNQLLNSTMETYHQGNRLFRNGFNCFVCHSSGADPDSLTKPGVSHMFETLYPLFPPGGKQ